MTQATIRVAKPPGRAFQVVVEADGRMVGTLSVSAPDREGQRSVSVRQLGWSLSSEQARSVAEFATAAVASYNVGVDIAIPTAPGLAAARPTTAGDAIVPGLASAAQLSLLTAHRKRYGFAQQLCAGRRVLDLACGAGYGARMLALVAREVVAADFDEQVLAEAAWRFPRRNIVHTYADGTRIPFPDATFDVAVSCETIEHLWPEQVALFLGHLRRVLAPDGTLILSTPQDTRPVDPQWGLVNLTGQHQRGHQVGFSAATLRAWLERFFPHVLVLYQGSERPADDPVPQLELWAEPPPSCETLVAVASGRPLDLQALRLRNLPLDLYDAAEVERFLTQPGVSAVHATLEKRGATAYAAFSLAHERPGHERPAYALLDYVRVVGLGGERPQAVLPAEWSAAAPLADALAALLDAGFVDLALPEQTFTALLPSGLATLFDS